MNKNEWPVHGSITGPLVMISNEGGGWEFPAFWTVTLIVQALLGDGAFSLNATRPDPASTAAA